MAYKIDEIEGIGPASSEKLSAAKIATTDDLLKLCCHSKGRKEISTVTGVSEGQLLNWANMADLMRISGVAGQYAELLKGAGVDTVKELRQRNPANLATKMKEINEVKKLAKTSPSASVVDGWVEQAQGMEPKITH